MDALQETLANRNALLEKFLAMQQQQQQARLMKQSPVCHITGLVLLSIACSVLCMHAAGLPMGQGQLSMIGQAWVGVRLG